MDLPEFLAGPLPMKTGQNLRDARKFLRLSQTAVADSLGVTRQTVAAFERDQRTPDLRLLAGMANLYRLTLDELVGGVISAIDTSKKHAVLPRISRDKPERNLDEQDRRELAEFDNYLRRRTTSEVEAFDRKPFETVRDTVERLRKRLKVEQVAPVPVFALIARLGIEVRFTVLGQLSGALLLPVDGRPAGILVNADQPFERQRFSAGHELGHLVRGHKADHGKFVSFLGRRFEPVEVDADAFAAELLTPADLLETRLGKVANEPLEEAVHTLSRAFAISFQAMSLRLFKLGMLGPDDFEELQKVKPTEVGKRAREARDLVSFDTKTLPAIAKRSLPTGWHEHASPDIVRTLQESAYNDYLSAVPEGNAADSAGGVYEHVALWVAAKYPIVPSS